MLTLIQRFLICSALAVGVWGCSSDPAVASRRHFDEANALLQDGKIAEGIIRLRNALQERPAFGEARLALAQAYARIGDVRNALLESVRAADLLPNDPKAQNFAAMYLLLAGRFEDAKERVVKVLAVDPHNVDAQILHANALAGLKDFSGALEQLEEAIALDPGRGASYANLGQIQLAGGHREEAEAAFKRALETDPKSINAHLALVNFYWAAQRMADAEATLKRAREIEPEHALVNRALANLYLSVGRIAEAEEPLKRLAEGAGAAPRLALADYYVRAQRRADAVRLLSSLPERELQSSAVQTRLALIQFADGERDAAHQTVDVVLAQDPSYSPALLAKARFLIEEKKLEEALTRVRAAVEADPRSLAARYTLGVLLLQRNEPEQAAQAFTEVVTMNPRASVASMQLSRLALARGDVPASVQWARDAITTSGNSLSSRLQLASALVAGSDPAGATEVALLAKSHPDVAAVQVLAGRVALSKRDPRSARASFAKAMQVDPNALDALSGMIGLELTSGNSAGARALVTERLAAKPDDLALLVLAGHVYQAIGDMNAAETTLRRAIDRDADYLPAYGALAQLYASRGRLEEAQAKFDALGQRQPNSVAAQTMAAVLVHVQGRGIEAEERYQRILRLDERAVVAANNLAWLYAERGANLDAALQLAQTAKEQSPAAPEINDTIGWIYYKKGLHTLAAAAFEVSVRAEPTNPMYRYRLGLAYLGAGDKSRARGALEQALSLKPDATAAAEVRKALSAL